jgi:hypothetical protein
LEFEINVEQAERHVQTDLSACLTFYKNFCYLALVSFGLFILTDFEIANQRFAELS